MASLGFVVTMMFASSGDEPLVRVTEYRLSLQSALTLFLCSVVFGFLTEAAIVGVSLGQQQRLFFGRWFDRECGLRYDVSWLVFLQRKVVLP